MGMFGSLTAFVLFCYLFFVALTPAKFDSGAFLLIAGVFIAVEFLRLFMERGRRREERECFRVLDI